MINLVINYNFFSIMTILIINNFLFFKLIYKLMIIIINNFLLLKLVIIINEIFYCSGSVP